MFNLGFHLVMLILKVFAVTGMVMVLRQHIEMAWWEGGVLSFAIMLLFVKYDTNRCN